jgi:hypothetical protein
MVFAPPIAPAAFSGGMLLSTDGRRLRIDTMAANSLRARLS